MRRTCDVAKGTGSPTKVRVVRDGQCHHFGIDIELVLCRGTPYAFGYNDHLGLTKACLKSVEAQAVGLTPQRKADVAGFVGFALGENDRTIGGEHAHQNPGHWLLGVPSEHIDVDVLVAHDALTGINTTKSLGGGT